MVVQRIAKLINCDYILAYLFLKCSFNTEYFLLMAELFKYSLILPRIKTNACISLNAARLALFILL